MPSVEVAVDKHITAVVLNRPDAVNSVDPEMRALLHQTWERIRTDDDIWVAIITGAGEKAFCTGSDLKKTMPLQESFASQTFGPAIPGAGQMVAGLDMDKPLIAAVNGYSRRVGPGVVHVLEPDMADAIERKWKATARS